MTANPRQDAPHYGYWTSWKLLLALGLLAVVLIALSYLIVYLIIGAVVVLAELVFLSISRYQMSARGANIQVKLWDILV